MCTVFILSIGLGLAEHNDRSYHQLLTINKDIIITCPFGGEGAGEYLKKQMDAIDQSSPETKPLIQVNFDCGQTVNGHDFAD